MIIVSRRLVQTTGVVNIYFRPLPRVVAADNLSHICSCYAGVFGKFYLSVIGRVKDKRTLTDLPGLEAEIVSRQQRKILDEADRRRCLAP